MKYIGINAKGPVLEYKRLSLEEEIALIQDLDTGSLLWRHKCDGIDYFVIDYNYEVADDIWGFEEFLKDKGMLDENDNT